MLQSLKREEGGCLCQFVSTHDLYNTLLSLDHLHIIHTEPQSGEQAGEPRHRGSGAEGILRQIRSGTGTYFLFALLQVAVWMKMQ